MHWARHRSIKHPVTAEPMTLTDVQGLFFTYIILIFLAFAALIFEIILYKWCCRREHKKKYSALSEILQLLFKIDRSKSYHWHLSTENLSENNRWLMRWIHFGKTLQDQRLNNPVAIKSISSSGQLNKKIQEMRSKPLFATQLKLICWKWLDFTSQQIMPMLVYFTDH